MIAEESEMAKSPSRKPGYLAERAGLEEVRRLVGEIDRPGFDLDPLLRGEGEHLADERRQRGSIDDHGGDSPKGFDVQPG